jgi:hypothetical protein
MRDMIRSAAAPELRPTPIVRQPTRSRLLTTDMDTQLRRGLGARFEF